MNVLSLFDGMSCGQLALNQLGFKIDNYFASEIDTHAMKITNYNYPNTIQLGSVTDVFAKNLPKIDLLIGGSPCQGFSLAGKQLNFNDPRSKLFFEFVRLLKECNPTYFLLENVVMKKEYEQIITDILGVQPILINSSLVSAQNRNRLYWTNIPNVTQPVDRNISFTDILEDAIKIKDQTYSKYEVNRGSIVGRRLSDKNTRSDYDKSCRVVQCLEVRSKNITKSNCLTTVSKDNVITPLPIGRHLEAFNNKLPFRYLNLEEYCKLQTVPVSYFYNKEGNLISSESQIKKMLGNGWTVEVIKEIFKNLDI